MANNIKKGTKTELIKLQMLLDKSDVELVYPVQTIYKFLINELNGYDKKQRYNQSRRIRTSMDYMFGNFVEELSPEGDFARDYLDDGSAPRDAMAFLKYLVDYVDSEEAIKLYFNIVQRTMDENVNYSYERTSNKDICTENSDYLEDGDDNYSYQKNVDKEEYNESSDYLDDENIDELIR